VGDGSSESNVSFPKQHLCEIRIFLWLLLVLVPAAAMITYVVKNSNNPIGSLIAPGNTTFVFL
jgi:hypothetical protein